MAGLMDELNNAVSKLQEAAKNVLDKTDIDEKIVAAAKDLKAKAQEALEKTDVDEKVVETAKGLKDKAQAVLDKTDVDEKIKEAAKGLKDKAQEAFKAATQAGEAKVDAVKEDTRDAMDKIRDEAKEQFEHIRAAKSGTDPIHEFMKQQEQDKTEE